MKCFRVTLIYLILQSCATWASKTVPYIKHMLLGRTFDYSKSMVGNDIFPAAVRNNPVITKHYKTSILYKVVKTSQDVRDVLDVSGQLSVQIMAGLVDVQGKGSYLKDAYQSGSFVEVLVKVTFQTVDKIITSDKKPFPGWDTRYIIGKHFIRGISYGGNLIASLRFQANNKKDLETIKGSAEANIKTKSTAVALKGQLEKLASSVKDISTLTIKYTATAPLTTVPSDIDSFVKAITDFPSMVAKVNGGDGVPVEVEIFPLSQLLDKSNTKFDFLLDRTIQTTLNNLEERYYDLRATSDAIKKFMIRNPELSEDGEKQFGALYSNVFKVTEIFNTAIASIDLNAKKSPNTGNQFGKAFDSYNIAMDGSSLPGKFLRKYKELAKKFEKKITTNNVVLRPSPCSDANWVSSFDKKGWSHCDNSENFITGFYRSKLESLDNDEIYRLEKAKCCPSSSLYTKLPSECKKADWRASINMKGTLSSCPSGYFLNGLYRSEGNKLHNIETGNCCKPSNHPNHYDHCYYEDIKHTFDKEGLSECLKIGYYVTGIYRNKRNTDGLHNIDQLKCCKMSLKTVVLQPSRCSDADWVSSFDKEGWSTCDNNANFIKGFYRSKRDSWTTDEISRLEKAKCCPSSSLYKNQPSECKKADWIGSFDVKGTWSVCPSGYFLNGLFRSGGNNLHNIEEGQCCKPGNHAPCYDDCYHENIEHTFDKEGWSQCQKTGYYVAGIHRNLGEDELHNLDELKCCKMWSGA